MTFESVEAVTPHRAIRLEPDIEFDERFGAKTVETSLTVRSNAHEARVTQHAKVFRDRRLTNRQLRDEVVDGVLATAQLIQDQSSSGLRDDFKR